MSSDEWIPYAKALAAIAHRGYGWTQLSNALTGRRVRSRGIVAGRADDGLVEIPSKFWAEWVFEPQFGWLIPRDKAEVLEIEVGAGWVKLDSAKCPVPEAYVEVRFASSDVENLAKEATAGTASDLDDGALPETARAHLKSLFDKQIWSCDQALAWIAFRKIETLALSYEELFLRRWAALRGYGHPDRFVRINPVQELLAALKAGKLEGIRSSGMPLPAAFCDDLSRSIRKHGPTFVFRAMTCAACGRPMSRSRRKPARYRRLTARRGEKR
jgi:hypothetical protein